MNFTIVTLFPEYFASSLSCGLMAKASETGLLGVSFVNPRDFATDRHRSVDNRPYGGGPGMVMLLEPLLAAVASIPRPGRLLVLSPKGKPCSQALIRELAAEQDLTLICGRYEGFDDRLGALLPVEPVSIGDFVLNGGEAGAAAMVEAVARLLPGFMGHADSGTEESFSTGLLEYPQFTRPEAYQGLEVPPILLSGDHARIAAWRREQSLSATLSLRPELLEQADLSSRDMAVLKKAKAAGEGTRLGRNLYIALVHHPVINKEGNTTAVSLTNLDVHDMSRVSRSYGLAGFYVTTPLDDQRRLARRILAHWLEGPGRVANPDRTEALKSARVLSSLDEAVEDIVRERGVRPRIVATSARKSGEMLAPVRVREWLAQSPLLLVFGTGHGLALEVLERADASLRPVRYMDDYNHLPVRSAVSILVDRILGDAY